MTGAAIFDLDGTLIDSRSGVEWAARAAVDDVVPGRELVGFLDHVGARVPELFARTLPGATPEVIAQVGLRFRHHYDSEGWKRNVPFAKVSEVLVALKADGWFLGLVTNKPSVPTRAIIQAHGWSSVFDTLVSPDSPPGWPSKAQALDHVVRSLRGRGDASAIYVGDTAEDHDAAQGAGASFVGAGYGYGRSGLELLEPLPLIIDDFVTLLDLVSLNGDHDQRVG